MSLLLGTVEAEIAARRLRGLSFAEIAAEIGLTKDVVQKRYARHVAPELEAGQGPGPSQSHKLAEARSTRAPATTVGFDVGFFDLETTALVADFGELLCACCAHSDGSVVTYRRTGKGDRKLAVATRDHLEGHDILVGYNSKNRTGLRRPGGFDVRFLQTRLVEAGERPFREPLHLDLLPLVRREFGLHSNRLASVQDFLGLEEKKTSIRPAVWRAALRGDAAALHEVEVHCQQDVLVLREGFLRVKAYIKGTLR